MSLILNLDDVPVNCEKQHMPSAPLLTHQTDSSANHAPVGTSSIVRKVLFTRTEITIYPDGQTFQTTKSWFQGGTQYVKKKEKKKKVPATIVKKSGVEEY